MLLDLLYRMITPERSNNQIMLVDLNAIASFNWDADLAAKLRTLREKKDLTRAVLSHLTHGVVSTRYIGQLERPDIYAGTAGKATNRVVSKAIVIALVDALGIELSDLFKVAKFSSPNS